MWRLRLLAVWALLAAGCEQAPVGGDNWETIHKHHQPLCRVHPTVIPLRVRLNGHMVDYNVSGAECVSVNQTVRVVPQKGCRPQSFVCTQVYVEIESVNVPSGCVLVRRHAKNPRRPHDITH